MNELAQFPKPAMATLIVCIDDPTSLVFAGAQSALWESDRRLQVLKYTGAAADWPPVEV
jgi:hypothetical protein